MKLKYIFSSAIIIGVLSLLVSCSDDILSGVAGNDSAVNEMKKVNFNVNVSEYDGLTSRAASPDWLWSDKDVVFVRFVKDDNSEVKGYLQQKNGEWYASWSGNLTKGSSGKLKAWYFDEYTLPSGWTLGQNDTIDLSHTIGVYATTEGTYSYSSSADAVTVTATLVPKTGRLRFKGTSGTVLKVGGIMTSSFYNLTTDSLGKTSSYIPVTVGTDGYTPYIYASLYDQNNTNITVTNGDYLFSHTVNSNFLKTGLSGYMDVPTYASHSNWTIIGGAANGHEYIDLGLPSGTLWATCNVGANSPSEYGDYFAWGETTGYNSGKTQFSWSNYKWCNGSSSTLTKYCTTSDYGKVDNKVELESTDDAATVNWESGWRMATFNEWYELKDNCTWTNESFNGIKGYKITGLNGNAIFIPYAGKRGTEYSTGCFYWSSTIGSPSFLAGYQWFLGGTLLTDYYYYRCDGLTVRPVRAQSKETPSEQTFTVKGIPFTMKLVPAGTFTMGATSEQAGAFSDEKPAHQVTISKDYYIGETEVTQALWKAVTGYSPTASGSSWSSSYGLGDNYPAYYISYTDCQEFITKLNSLTGKTFRMPTEAEWEYAARGGNKSKGYLYSGSNTIGDVAWYWDNGNYTTHVVKGKAANELGLYDMSGNVWEWCSDWYSSSYYTSAAATDPQGPTTGSYRVLRGGSWYSAAAGCRVAIRYDITPSIRDYRNGFRLALSSSQK